MFGLRKKENKKELQVKVQLPVNELYKLNRIIQAITKTENSLGLKCTTIEVEVLDLDTSIQSIPEKTLAWMKSVEICDFGKPMEFFSLHGDRLYSRDYLAETPLEEIIERHRRINVGRKVDGKDPHNYRKCNVSGQIADEIDKAFELIAEEQVILESAEMQIRFVSENGRAQGVHISWPSSEKLCKENVRALEEKDE